jgi:hypothetical protein
MDKIIVTKDGNDRSLSPNSSLFVYSKQWRLLLLFAKSFAVSGVMIGRLKAQQQTFPESPLLPFLPLRRPPKTFAPFPRSLIACCSLLSLLCRPT